MSIENRNPFRITLMELLVVLAIIFVLVGLLMPSIQIGTERPRRSECANNLHQISAAFSLYEQTYGALPGYKDSLSFDRPITLGEKLIDRWPVGWPVMIMRELQRNDLYTLWKEGGDESFLVTGAPSPVLAFPIFVCASNPPDSVLTQPLAYAVNSGMADGLATAQAPADLQANGMFFNRFGDAEGAWGDVINGFKDQIVTTSLEYSARHDGRATTILLSENRDNNHLNWIYAPILGYNPAPYAEPSLGLVWWANEPANTPATDIWQFNGSFSLAKPLTGQSCLSDDIEWARPSSYHPGGVNVAFCDEHVRFISDSIDYFVYCQLMSPHGANVAPPAGAQGINQTAFEENAYRIFRTTPLDENLIP